MTIYKRIHTLKNDLKLPYDIINPENTISEMKVNVYRITTPAETKKKTNVTVISE